MEKMAIDGEMKVPGGEFCCLGREMSKHLC